MINQIPTPNTQYTYYQANTGDSSQSGNIWSSMNIDLETNKGVLRLGSRLIANTTRLTEANMTDIPISFTTFDGEIWAIAGGRIWSTADPFPSDGFSENTDAGSKTNYDDEDSDLDVFDGKLWASNADGWYTKTSKTSGWTQTTDTPTAGITHYFRRTDRLYIVQLSDIINSIDGAGAYSTTDFAISLTQATDNEITCLASNTDSIWIGAHNKKQTNRRASIFRWDGVSPQVSEIYRLKASRVLAMAVLDDIPYCIDNLGILSKFTGSSFEEVAKLPIANGSGVNDFSLENYMVQRNGMIVTENGTIQILARNILENSVDSTPENFPSGVWEYSKDFGLYHKHGITYTPRDTTTITDYGQNRLFAVGALAIMDVADDTSSRNGRIIAGCEYNTASSFLTDTPRNYGIFYDDYTNTCEKKGYFVTTWFQSTEIQDKWERLWIVYRQLLNSTDSIVCKYRLIEVSPVISAITWVNTTSFTTTVDITAYSPTALGFDGVIGGEVEFIQGVGSGACVHITNISEAGGTYTVTIDTPVTGATTTTAIARFQKWIKLNPSDSATGTVVPFQQMAIGASNPSIQLKVCMTFNGTNQELLKLALVSNEDITISQ